jgi:hypothetical protein
MTAELISSRLRLTEGPNLDQGDVMSQQSVRKAARRSALDTQAVLRKERADRDRQRVSSGRAGRSVCPWVSSTGSDSCLAIDPTPDCAMAKSWKCRLRLHKWDDRENPETHAHYQVCLRCNAYRDRGQAAPGAGAAGITGSGIG